MNKILLINKDAGYTSNYLVNMIKRKYKISKVGHAGTLDPFATGLMIVLCDEATKISNYLICDNKSYTAKLIIGKETETLDTEGSIIKEKEVPSLTKDLIESAFNKFIGSYNQIPPVYSAIKINGQKLCNQVRQGLEVEVKPRLVHINKLELLEYGEDYIKFYVECSKGTYIRSLGRDIAHALNTVGYLEELCRNSSGKFNLKDAIKVEDITKDSGLTIAEALDLKTYQVNDQLALDIRNGKQISLDSNEELVLLVNKENIELAIYKKNGNMYKCFRGFHVC